MDQQEMLFIATKAISKKWDYETMKYSDDLYDYESLAEEVWEYVEECEEIGTAAFREKYKDFKLYF